MMPVTLSTIYVNANCQDKPANKIEIRDLLGFH